MHQTMKPFQGDMTIKEILEMPIVQDHERLKKEFCRMWQQQEKLLKTHVLLIESCLNVTNASSNWSRSWKSVN